jgi:hypothetical protein
VSRNVTRVRLQEKSQLEIMITNVFFSHKNPSGKLFLDLIHGTTPLDDTLFLQPRSREQPDTFRVPLSLRFFYKPSAAAGDNAL